MTYRAKFVEIFVGGNKENLELLRRRMEERFTFKGAVNKSRVRKGLIHYMQRMK